jgi:hypothetical protein
MGRLHPSGTEFTTTSNGAVPCGPGRPCYPPAFRPVLHDRITVRTKGNRYRGLMGS